MKTYVWIVFVLLFGSVVSAQTVPPALMVQENGRSMPLGLVKLETQVRIVGAVAQTAATMTFTNPLPRVMEGNLYFPLPEGATISGYALDIRGRMIDGMAVEKHEARRVFEEVVRRGVDPGLVEWTKGNNFQTRVFPIPANGSRTIRVQYVTELGGGREAPSYHLPLAFKDPLPEFALRIEVVKPQAPPKVLKGELARFSFEKWRESYVAETEQHNWTPVEDLVIALPKVEQPQVVVEKADDGQVYFAVHDDPRAPQSDLPVTTAKHAVVFWDASGSRAGDHGREIALVQRFLGQLLPSAADTKAKMIVDLVLVRNAAAEPVRIEFSKSDPKALAAALEKVQYDGGTQLGVIGPLKGEKPDLYLLFTDGLSNFGREEPARLDAPLYVFSASATSNHSFLHSLVMANGGRYFNLANWKDAEILAQAGRPAWLFLSASIAGGEARDLYPQRPQPISGRFTLVGKLNGDGTTITVDYGIQGRAPDKRTFKVSRSDAIDGSLLRCLWAQKKLAELLIFQKKNEKQIAALGKQFGMVTPFTSLLVLDTLEQYVQYDIAPPQSLGAMREEYMRRIDTLEHQKQKQKADKLAEVIRMWEERVKWWETQFKYRKDFKYTGGQEKAAAGERGNFERNRAVRSEMAPEALEVGPASVAPAGRAANPSPSAARRPAPGFAPSAGAPRAPAAKAARYGGPILSSSAIDLDSQSLGAKGGRRGKAGGKAINFLDEMERAGEDSSGRQPGIVIKEWSPDTPYLKDLKAARAKKSSLFAVYMKNRARYGASPAFFLDCGDFFRDAGESKLALQVLSNIAELQLEEPTLLRVLGHRLLQIGELDLAVQTFEQVLELRPEEPQSLRDLALTLARRAEAASQDGSRPADAVRDDYRRAVDLLVRLILTRWDARFPEIEVIALEEVNRIIPKANAAGVSDIPLDPRLVKLLDVDVRIVMTWQADNTDIDLWVVEPSGEKAFYAHNRTTIGGLVSRDFTQGYGPEEYMVRRAAHGMYKIQANYFGSQATRLLGAVTVQADVFTNYGRENEQRKSLTLRLKAAQETVPIGEIEF